MTVKELIEELQELESPAFREIFFMTEDELGHFAVGTVTVDEDGDVILSE